MKNKIIVLFLIFSFILISGVGCKKPNKEIRKMMEPITLKYWRVFDEPDAFTDIINKYQAVHPFITIEYKKFRYEEYEKELINALAEDRGPDIFSIPSTWLTEYQNKITPLPPQITMVYPVVKGTVKKETVPEMRTSKSLTLRELKNNFVDIVYSGMVLKKNDKEEIYGLPLYIDTLAMYYNKNLLNNAGLTEAPKYWNEDFQKAIKKLTKQNNKGIIIQSGVALGGSKNINRSTDILSVLMMQNRAIMMENEKVLFHSIPPGLDRDTNPGLGALIFYSDFANPAKEVYCWNSSMDNSLTLFSQGNVAIMFGYSYDLPTIKARNPKLDFAIAKLPQLEGNSKQINYANYWAEVVSAKSKYSNEAWDFIQFATKEEQVQSYLNKTNKPTALRNLIKKQIDDINIGPFVEQILTAQSWYYGKNFRAAEEAFEEMIDLTVEGKMEIENILSQGAKKVQQTID